MFRHRYWKEPYFKALASIKEVADKHNLTMPEVALGWITHHSQLKREYGDSVLVGASSLPHIKQVIMTPHYHSKKKLNNFYQNLIDLEKGPLRKSFLQIVGLYKMG